MATMVVGLDSSDSSSRALRFATDLARAEGADLFLVHVIQWSPFALSSAEDNEMRSVRRTQELQEAHQRILEPALEQVRGAGVEATSAVRHGHPAETIIDLAVEHDAQQVIIGRVGDSRFRQIVFGSLTAQLTQACPVPVTVVP